MSSITYNGVSLDLVRIHNFNQERIATEDGIDYLYSRFTLRAQCIFSFDLQGANPADWMSQVRMKLNTERQPLEIKIGNSYLLKVNAPDHKGGPFPKVLSMSKIAGTRTAWVEWECEAFLHDCQSPPDVLANRWEMSQSYTADFFATRTTNGRLIARAIGTPPKVDELRALCMPALPAGWKRERMTFAVSSDGLSLGYSIEDREVDRVAPDPATTANARYVEMTEHAATHFFGDIHVDLRGSKGTSRRELITTAAKICAERFDSEQDMVLSTEIAEELFDNRITMSMRVRKNVKDVNQLKPGFLIDHSKLGMAVDGASETGQSKDLSDREGLVRSVAAAWKRPCQAPDQGVGPVPTGDTDPPTGTTEDPEITVSDEPLPNDGEPKFSQGERDLGLYSDYQMDVQHRFKHHTLQLPVASDAPPLSSGAAPFKNNCIVPFGQSYELWLRGRGERHGALPKLPGPSNGDWEAPGTKLHDPQGNPLKEFIKHNRVKIETPRLAPDGTSYIYGVGFEMVIVCEGVPDLSSPDQTLAMGRLPYTTGGETEMPSTVFTTQILFPDGQDA